MTNFYRTFINSIMVLGVATVTSQSSLQSMEINATPFGKRIMKIIDSEGQEGVCKKFGPFRENGGQNCSDRDIALTAVTFCNSNDFKSSQCYTKASRILGSKAVLEAPAEFEQAVKLKGQGAYSITCGVKRENLKGIVLAIANRSCDGSSASSIPSLTVSEKQKLKAIIEKDLLTVEAVKNWVSTKPTTERGNISIGTQRSNTVVIKALAPTSSARRAALLKSAEDLNAAFRNLNRILEGKTDIKIDGAKVDKLDNFSNEVRDASSSERTEERMASLIQELDNIIMMNK